MEQSLAADFGVVSVKLIPIDAEQVDRSVTPPVGYAVLDMVKISKDSGENPPIEAHLMGSENEHIVVLSRMVDGDELVGHARWALDLSVVTKATSAAKLSSGYAELAQKLSKGKPVVLSRLGNKRYRGGPPALSSKVKGTAWQVAFWRQAQRKKASFSDSLPVPLPVLGGVVGVLLLALIAVFVLRMRRKQITVNEVEEGGDSVGEVTPTDGDQTADGMLDTIADGPMPLPEVEVEEADEPSAEIEPAIDTPAVEAPASVTLSPEIFRAYDIRGVVGKSLNADVVRDIGRAIGSGGLRARTANRGRRLRRPFDRTRAAGSAHRGYSIDGA